MSPGRHPEESQRYTAIARKLDDAGTPFKSKSEKAAEIARIFYLEEGRKPSRAAIRKLADAIRHYL
jgi:hypothetical protein